MFSKRSLAITSLICVGAGYAILGVASRWLAMGFAPMTQVCLRLALATIVAAIVFQKHIKWHKYKMLPVKDWLGLMIMGIIGYALVVYLLTLGALNTTLLNVSIMYSMVPFFAGLFGWIFFRQKLNYQIVILILISLWGVTIIGSQSLLPSLGRFGLGEIYSLLSAIAASWYVLARKMLSNKLNDQEITVMVLIIATISSFSFSLLMKEQAPNFGVLSQKFVLIGLLIGGLLNIISTYLEVFAFKILPSVVGSQLLLSESIFSLIFGFVLFKETVSPLQVVGASLIIASVYVMNKIQST